MGVFKRLSDLLKSNVNDLIDRAEDPEKMVKQVIIDMQTELTKATQNYGKAKASGADASEEKGPATVSDDSEKTDAEGSSNLHLMNDSAPVFVCKDALATALFYETKLGFSATHLDDESMPHICLNRDNIHIILVQAKEGDAVRPLRELYGIPYDLFIYVSEPMMLQLELQGAGVSIVKALDSADSSVNTNREFVFADNDGRHICVSHRA